jgi:chromosome partitioning protein
MPARVLGLCNNKGGITKTTTSINLAYSLATEGKRVLLIDTDAQSNATWTVAQKILVGKHNTLYETLMERRPLHEIIRPTDNPNLFIARSSMKLAEAEVELIGADNREHKLRNAIKPYLKHFDYIIIDTPPNLGLLTINAMTACTDIIIPLTLSEYSLIGITILLRRIKELRNSAEENGFNIPLNILGVTVAMQRETKDSQDHAKAIREYFEELVFEPFIPLNVSVEESNRRLNKNLLEHAPNSKGAIAYKALADAVDQRVEGIDRDPEAYQQRTTALFDRVSLEVDEEEDDE